MATDKITIEHVLFEVSARAISELLLDAVSDGKHGGWDHVIGEIKRHGFLDKIEPAPFTALGWKRVPIECDRNRLFDPEYRNSVAHGIAEQWIARLLRDASEADKVALLKLDAAIVIQCLHERYVSHLTGASVAQAIMHRTLDRNVLENPSIAESLRDFDRKIGVIARTHATGLERQGRLLKKRIDAKADEVSRDLDSRVNLVRRLMEKEHRLSDCERGVCGDGNK